MLQVTSIRKSYGDNTILQDVSFVVNAGDRLALVGPNGCGKTTLLRLIAGEEPADSGSVQLSPPDLRLGYLRQGMTYHQAGTVRDYLHLECLGLQAAEDRVEELARRLEEAGGWEATLVAAYGQALSELERLAGAQRAVHEAEAMLAGLRLGNVPLETPVATLSGGQKTRLGLARLLLDRPEVLLLDEPTNHLDIEALAWLERWLLDYRGATLVVSHDRALLDRVATAIVEIDPHAHSVREFAGNYTGYLERKDAERQRQWDEYSDQNEEIARLRAAAQHLRGLGRPHKGGKADGGDKFAKGFFANRGRYAVRRAKQIERRVERLLTDERVEKPRPNWQMKLDLSGAPATGKDVVVLENLAVGYESAALLSGVNEHLRAGERVAVVGPNGAGKTTLLRTIAGELPPLAGRVSLGTGVRLGYYAQEQENLDPKSTPLDIVAAVGKGSETEMRAFLHCFLFTGDDVFVPVSSLSYGERARLLLARLVAEGCNCLLLDEPINHLDIPSRASFERALAAFEGTVLVVTHDRYFIRQFAKRLWFTTGGTVQDYYELGDLPWQAAHA